MTIRNYIFICCIFLLLSSCASRKIEKEQVFTPQLFYPKYPGGDNELRKFLTDNMCYPSGMLGENEEDYIVANCLIGKDGSVKQVTTISVFENEFSKEVERVLWMLPKFIPGPARGKPADGLYVIPVYFRIPQEDERRPFLFVEQISRFPGGDREFEKYISDNIKYSFIDRIGDKKGEQQIHFELDKVGTLKYSKIVKSLSPKYDNCALDIVNKMPQWIPGSGRGSTLALYSLTISYDTKWTWCFPQSQIKCKLEYFILSEINTDKLPEDFFDDIFENEEKVRFLEPVYIIGHK